MIASAARWSSARCSVWLNVCAEREDRHRRRTRGARRGRPAPASGSQTRLAGAVLRCARSRVAPRSPALSRGSRRRIHPFEPSRISHRRAAAPPDRVRLRPPSPGRTVHRRTVRRTPTLVRPAEPPRRHELRRTGKHDVTKHACGSALAAARCRAALPLRIDGRGCSCGRRLPFRSHRSTRRVVTPSLAGERVPGPCPPHHDRDRSATLRIWSIRPNPSGSRGDYASCRSSPPARPASRPRPATGRASATVPPKPPQARPTSLTASPSSGRRNRHGGRGGLPTVTPDGAEEMATVNVSTGSSALSFVAVTVKSREAALAGMVTLGRAVAETPRRPSSRPCR